MPAGVTPYTPAPATKVAAVDCERSVAKSPAHPGPTDSAAPASGGASAGTPSGGAATTSAVVAPSGTAAASAGTAPASTAPASTEPLRAGSVPTGFTPVQLVKCFPPEPTLDAQGQVSGWTIKQLWFTGDFTMVVAALALPSERQGGVACLAMAEVLPSLWLVNAKEQAVNVLWPVDVCGMAKPELSQALEDLTLSESKLIIVAKPAS